MYCNVILGWPVFSQHQQICVSLLFSLSIIMNVCSALTFSLFHRHLYWEHFRMLFPIFSSNTKKNGREMRKHGKIMENNQKKLYFVESKRIHNIFD